jgi:hypothetical protein
VAEEPSWDGSQDQGQGHGGGGGAPAEASGHKQHADRVYADPWTVSVKKQASEGPMRRRVAPHRAGSAASSRPRVVSHHAHVKPRVTIPVPQTNVKSEQNGHWLWLTRPSINGGVTGVYSREQWAACGGLTTASGSGQDFLCLCLPFFVQQSVFPLFAFFLLTSPYRQNWRYGNKPDQPGEDDSEEEEPAHARYHYFLLTCYLLLATCCWLLATCYLLLATCYLPLATCHLPLATCHWLLATTCFLAASRDCFFFATTTHHPPPTTHHHCFVAERFNKAVLGCCCCVLAIHFMLS